jgi:hypothetical protein
MPQAGRELPPGRVRGLLSGSARDVEHEGYSILPALADFGRG